MNACDSEGMFRMNFFFWALIYEVHLPPPRHSGPRFRIAHRTRAAFQRVAHPFLFVDIMLARRAAKYRGPGPLLPAFFPLFSTFLPRPIRS